MDLEIHRMDVKTTFLNEEFEGEINIFEGGWGDASRNNNG